MVLDWRKDGKYILYLKQTGEQIWISGSLMALPLDGDRKPIPVVKTQFTQIGAAISPDGRWVAYSSNDSGGFQLYVQAFLGMGPQGRWQISDGSAYDIKNGAATGRNSISPARTER
ncbi:MAG TPA: hypothetical protein VK752_17655 [Bryobacteraceae bacterium]|nr:hypothetical protein [Bryobacteraceae bacterium]